MEIDPRVLPDSQNEEMANSLEIQESQQTPEGKVAPEPTIDVKELKSRAEVSSQNFERAKKAELEVKELRKLLEEKKSSEEPEYLSDEGKMLKEQISSLKSKLSSFEETQALDRVSNLYPAIKDKQDEFNEFRLEYPNIGLDKVAKLFVAEKGYVDQLKPRIGLEKPTGGFKSQQKTGISNDEVKRLRETQPRRYEQMLRAGKLNPADIV